MKNSVSTSLLTVLSLYTSLRRSGSSELAAQDKLRGLVFQLAADDRTELLQAVRQWEAEHGQAINEHNAAKGQQRAQRPVTENVLNGSHGILSCPNCCKKNDSAEAKCVFCGSILESAAAIAPQNKVPDNWFGPDSKLLLTINGVVHPAEIAVRKMVVFGRHTPDDSTADIDLSEYRGDVFGVSRVHASLKLQNNTLLLVDLNSTNHTYLNESQLKDNEARPISQGDKIRMGNLVISVAFKHLRA